MSENELPDDARIDVDIDDEPALGRWAQRLGTDPARLRAALAAVGPEVRRLRDFLAGAPQSSALLPDGDPHDANGPAGPPHYDIHKEAS
ncbi:DUF3606 domain-containing protein [Caldimonas tepidiphila]|uniref:DUF3606 domain-containing protein n=1 Tax=Caldimonas tepidiphila TaxID=2315841 RepID=UPI00130034F1|nr:DUF3606 domain-containing protein [Caldimonas tepidiphila]